MIIFYAVLIVVLPGIVAVALAARTKGHQKFKESWRAFASLHGLTYHETPEKYDWPRIEGNYGGVPVSIRVQTSGVRVRTFSPLYEAKFAFPLPEGMRLEHPRTSFGRPSWSIPTSDPELDKAVRLGVKNPADAALLVENRKPREAVLTFFRECGKSRPSVSSGGASILGLPEEKGLQTLLARLESLRKFVLAVDEARPR
ncbi:MAG: hypothetical protein FJY82_15750 [Candidatus Aminicenantes bacterium]|nr:hypothetical protein [Candidatus Aminicenantes bacterium]